MYRTPSKLGVFNLLKSSETKGGECYAIVGPQWQPVCTCRHILPSQEAVSIYVTSKQIGLLPFGFVEECILLFDVTVNYTGSQLVLPPPFHTS